MKNYTKTPEYDNPRYPEPELEMTHYVACIRFTDSFLQLAL